MFPSASESQVTVDDNEIQFLRETGNSASVIILSRLLLLERFWFRYYILCMMIQMKSSGV